MDRGRDQPGPDLTQTVVTEDVEAPPARRRLDSARTRFVVGAAVSVAVAAVLYARFGIHGRLARDEGIYSYAGERLAHGIPPYQSIFDPKAPLATFVAGAGAALARLFGGNELSAIRLAFYLCSVLTVLAVYVLARRLWRSTAAAVVAAVAFASFYGFAGDALSGPDAKTPGILFAVLSMWLVVRRSWFLGALTGSLATLTWQPLLVYPAVALVLAVTHTERGRRRGAAMRATAGVVLPWAATAVYFAAAGAFHPFVSAALLFPLWSAGHAPPLPSFASRIDRIGFVVRTGFHASAVVLVVGMVCLLLLVAARVVARRSALRELRHEPLVIVVLSTLAFEALFALYNFSGTPDVFPFLPYAALGVAGTTAVAVRAARRPAHRGIAVAAALTAAGVLAGFSFVWYAADPTNDVLRAQVRAACGLDRVLGPPGRLYSAGDPVPLLLTHRVGLDNYIYLQAGVAEWKVDHTPGGFAAWQHEVAAAAPTVVLIHTWHGLLSVEFRHWLLHNGYARRYLGQWQLYLTPPALERSRRAGVQLTRQRGVADGLPQPGQAGPSCG